MRGIEFVKGLMVYNPVYAQILQTTATRDPIAIPEWFGLVLKVAPSAVSNNF